MARRERENQRHAPMHEAPGRVMTALGLMSGTSLDGVDGALIRTDGEDKVEFGAALTIPYEAALRDRLRRLLGREVEGCEAETGVVAVELTEAHVRCVHELLRRAGLRNAEVDVVGFHGQTILHRPNQRRTVQIGDGARLAHRTGIDVVDNFRRRDVEAGGEGAPLAPLYHAALARALARPLAVLNLGGVANLTWVGHSGEILAFDTGPGNALLDDWVGARTDRTFDKEGRIAAGGRIDKAVLERLLAHPYFGRRPPKSLDRGDFTTAALGGMSLADGAATLVAFTAGAVGRALDHLPAPPRRWLVTGGGRHNPVLMRALAGTLEAPVEAVESVGWDGDALEAQAFAYLAVRSLKGLALSLPSTTGVGEPLSGGSLHRWRLPGL
jgi:anhydro-N-acetylmuramic acid kinase